ncbi:MAG TPA: hypothetical protein VN408_21400 [Actinoplanes sp.]|nr:hypothetical protein [Actinoplanes sp.]
MSTSDWPQAEPALERAYRRLLYVYPHSYRHRHGTELVTTLLEMAEPGRTRPAAADVRHMIITGVAQRFRLPSGRPLATAAAVLALLGGAALGAAGTSWAAAQTFAALPTEARGAQILTLLAGTPTTIDVNTYYGTPDTGASVSGTTSVRRAAWDPAAARDRLTADGWQVGPLRDTDRLDAPVPGPEHGFQATRDGLLLTAHGESDVVTATVHVAGNTLLRPAVATGLLLGAVSGWLFAGAVARRRSRLAALFAAGTLTVLFAPVWSLSAATVTVFTEPPFGTGVRTVHSVLQPGSFWPPGPAWMSGLWPSTPWAGIGLVAFGLLLAAATIAVSPACPDRPAPSREVAL